MMKQKVPQQISGQNAGSSMIGLHNQSAIESAGGNNDDFSRQRDNSMYLPSTATKDGSDNGQASDVAPTFGSQGQQILE